MILYGFHMILYGFVWFCIVFHTILYDSLYLMLKSSFFIWFSTEFGGYLECGCEFVDGCELAGGRELAEFPKISTFNFS